MIPVDVVESEDENVTSVAQERQKEVDVLIDETKEHLQEWQIIEDSLGDIVKEEIESAEKLFKFIVDETNEGI